MKWHLSVGPIREKLEALKRRGQLVPVLDNEPVLYPDLALFWSAFSQLHSCRDNGMGGPGGLKATEIIAYLELNGITDIDSRRDYFHFLRFLDSVYLKWHNETQSDGKHNPSRSRSQK